MRWWLFQVLTAAVAMHYGSNIALHDPTFGLAPRPLIPHPCVVCSFLTGGAPPNSRTTTRLPLSYCGYGASNFSWIEYGSGGGPGTVGQAPDPFLGLGFPKTAVPSSFEVNARIRALKEVWNMTESVEQQGVRGVGVGTGLHEDQLWSLDVRLDAMRTHMDLVRKELGARWDHDARGVGDLLKTVARDPKLVWDMSKAVAENAADFMSRQSQFLLKWMRSFRWKTEEVPDPVASIRHPPGDILVAEVISIG